MDGNPDVSETNNLAIVVTLTFQFFMSFLKLLCAAFVELIVFGTKK